MSRSLGWVGLLIVLILVAVMTASVMSKGSKDKDRDKDTLPIGPKPAEPIGEPHIPEPPVPDPPPGTLTELNLRDEKEAQENAKKRPAISQTELAKHYPAGRRVQTLAVLEISGKSDGTSWGLGKLASFIYEYHIVSDLEILGNDGKKLTVRQSFPTVARKVARSNSAIELRLPDDPLAIVLGGVVSQFLEPIPAFRVVKSAKEILEIQDPRLRRTLTGFRNALRVAGVPLPNESTGVLLKGVEDRLSGAVLQMEFVPDFGVTDIRVVSGPKFSRGELLTAGLQAGQFLDDFVFPMTASKPGQEWTISDQHLGPLLWPLTSMFHGPVTKQGKLVLRRKADSPPDSQSLVQFEAVRGALVLAGELSRGKEFSGKLNVDKGSLSYSDQEHLVREAELDLTAGSEFLSTDHLLFEARDVRDLTITVRVKSREAASSGGTAKQKGEGNGGEAKSQPAPPAGRVP